MFVVDGRAPAQAELQFLDKQLEIGGKGGGEQQAKRRETKRNETKRASRNYYCRCRWLASLASLDEDEIASLY